MTALVQTITTYQLPARAPGALATSLQRLRRIVRERRATHGEFELKLFGGPRADAEPELAELFLRYPPI